MDLEFVEAVVLPRVLPVCDPALEPVPVFSTAQQGKQVAKRPIHLVFTFLFKQ